MGEREGNDGWEREGDGGVGGEIMKVGGEIGRY